MQLEFLKTSNVSSLKRVPIRLKTKSYSLSNSLQVSSKPLKQIPSYASFFKRLSIDYNLWGFTVYQTSVNTVQGVLTENGKPLPNVMVYIYHSRTGALASKTRTDTDGFFVFDNLTSDVIYNVTSYDPKGVYNSVTIDGVRIDSRKEYNTDVG